MSFTVLLRSCVKALNWRISGEGGNYVVGLQFAASSGVCYFVVVVVEPEKVYTWYMP